MALKHILFIVFTLCFCGLYGQQAQILFYNAENFFDTEDDTLTNDNEFLPDSLRNWNYEKYWRKVVRLYQVISASSQWDMPAIVGFCEVENRKVLENLVYDTPLEKHNYGIIHKDSPDPRGIDVAVIYRKDLFRPDSVVWLKVDLGGQSLTREIMQLNGMLWDVPVHVYVNHWPSRSGGALSSDYKRIKASSTLLHSIEKLCVTEPNANILVMGDFNDEPSNQSIKMLTSMTILHEDDTVHILSNISPKTGWGNDIGTIKHQGVWSVFDQMLVSNAVMTGRNGIVLPMGQAEIFRPPFLLEPDPGYAGQRPFRTYLGPNYHNGFSDHLPVSMIVERRDPGQQ